MSDLLRLVYASKANTGSESVDSVLPEILNQSRRNNEPKNIGGVLCFGDGCFFQCLEGERAAVESLYDRLLEDDRHCEVTLLSKRPVRQRMFRLWNMKYMSVDAKIRRMLQIEKMESFVPHQFSDLMVDRLLVELRDASEGRRPAPPQIQRSGPGSRQESAARSMLPGLMFASATGIIAILAGLMLAGLV